MPPVTLHWYQGIEKPQAWRDGTIPKWGDGVLFIGSKGMLISEYGKHLLLPEKDFRDFQPPKPSIPKSLGHWAEWIHACQDRRAHDLQLRVRRLAHRGEPPRQRRVSRRQEARVGPGQDVRPQRPRGRGVHPPRISQGMVAGVVSPLWLAGEGASGAGELGPLFSRCPAHFLPLRRQGTRGHHAEAYCAVDISRGKPTSIR